MFRYHLLGLLQTDDLHGYALMKEYRRRSGLQISPGAFYRELRTLAEDGMVRRVRDENADPRRAPYTITDLGSRTFNEWFDAVPPATHCPDDDFASRLLFFAQVTPQRASRVVELWKNGLWQSTRDLEAGLRREAVRGTAENDSAVLLLQRRLNHITTDLRFLSTVQEAFELPECSPAELTSELPAYGRPRRSSAG